MTINNPEQRSTNPDIAQTSQELNDLHAQPARVPAPEHRDDRDKKLGWKKPAAVVALLGAGAAAALGIGKAMGGNEATPTPDRSPSASATPTPGETTEPSEGPEFTSNADAIGTPFTDFEHLNVKPEQYVVDRAKQPTLVADFSNQADAASDLLKKQNVYFLSGELQDTQGEQFETDESLAEGNAIIENLYSHGMDPAEYEGASEIRKSVALRTGMFPIVYGEGEVVNGESGEMEYATWNKSFETPIPIEQSETSATFEYTMVNSTNYGAVDRSDMFDNDDIDTSYTLTVRITIVQEGNKWVIDNTDNLG